MKHTPLNKKAQRAIAEVQARIQVVYPDAVFRVYQGEEPVGIYIDVYTDAEDSFCIFDLVNDWLVDLNVNEGLSIHVIPLPKGQAAMTQP
jgi:hypothetical protein